MHTLARKMVRAGEDFYATLTAVEQAKTGDARKVAMAACKRATLRQHEAIRPVSAIPESQIETFSMILREEEAVAKVRLRRRQEVARARGAR